jgi:hypothetical protein
MPRFYLSPSRIARYYYLECDRYLRFMAVPSEGRAAEGIPKPESDYSPVTRAVLTGGYVWEAEVIGTHLAGKVVLPAGEGELHERQLSYSETVEALRALRDGEGVYQPRLQVPGPFYERFGIDRDLLELRDCFPDLILAESPDGHTELRVIDVKASNWMKLSHRIQVGIYTLILEEVLRTEGYLQGESGVAVYRE